MAKVLPAEKLTGRRLTKAGIQRQVQSQRFEGGTAQFGVRGKLVQEVAFVGLDPLLACS